MRRRQGGRGQRGAGRGDGSGVVGSAGGRAAASGDGGRGVGGGDGAGENANGCGRSACAGGNGAGASFGRTGAVGTCVRFSDVMAASGIRPSGSGGAGVGCCLGGGGSGGLGCSKLTSMGSSAGGRADRFCDIHHSASTTNACSRTASARAGGDMWSERKEEALIAWATRPLF